MAEDVFYTFWFEKNLLGDVVGVYDENGTKLVGYVYDGYRRGLEDTYDGSTDFPAFKNPFGYRGYYYDRDLAFYYLGSRYYDWQTGRFISPDSTEYLGANGDLNSFNLYAFAGNTVDMNIFGTTYYAGLGVNLFDIVGLEAQPETVGASAQLKFEKLSVGAKANLIGATSVTIGWDTDLGNGVTRTDGFTVEANTGLLITVIARLYQIATTGNTSPVPGMSPA